MTGKHAAIRRRNEMDVTLKRDRDQAEKQALIDQQQKERQTVQQEIIAERLRYGAELAGLYRDLARTQELREPERGHDHDQKRKPVRRRKRGQEHDQSHQQTSNQTHSRNQNQGRSRTLERSLDRSL